MERWVALQFPVRQVTRPVSTLKDHDRARA
jgi:hypothetical protein